MPTTARWIATAIALFACSGSAPPPASPDREPKEQVEHGEHGGDHSGHFEHRFTGADKWAKRFDDPSRDAWQKPAEVIALLEISAGMTVADIGAGTGYFLPHLSRAAGDGGAVLGLDIEPDMVRHMTERAADSGLDNVEARVVEPGDPKLAPGSVDRILLVNTWHHIPARDRYSAALRRALKPGGLVAVVDYTRDAPRGPPARHRLPPEVVVRELEAGGLRAEIATETLPHQYVVIGRAE